MKGLAGSWILVTARWHLGASSGKIGALDAVPLEGLRKLIAQITIDRVSRPIAYAKKPMSSESDVRVEEVDGGLRFEIKASRDRDHSEMCFFKSLRDVGEPVFSVLVQNFCIV